MSGEAARETGETRAAAREEKPMHYRTSRYRTKIRYIEYQERKKQTNKEIGAQRMILSDLQPWLRFS